MSANGDNDIQTQQHLPHKFSSITSPHETEQGGEWWFQFLIWS